MNHSGFFKPITQSKILLFKIKTGQSSSDRRVYLIHNRADNEQYFNFKRLYYDGELCWDMQYYLNDRVPPENISGSIFVKCSGAINGVRAFGNCHTRRKYTVHGRQFCNHFCLQHGLAIVQFLRCGIRPLRRI